MCSFSALAPLLWDKATAMVLKLIIAKNTSCLYCAPHCAVLYIHTPREDWWDRGERGHEEGGEGHGRMVVHGYPWFMVARGSHVFFYIFSMHFYKLPQICHFLKISKRYFDFLGRF